MELSDPNKNKITSEEYFHELIQVFPELKEKIMEEESFHFKMECFAEYSIGQILISNWDKLKACFDFQEKYIEFLNPLLENAINVSFCEALLLGDVAKDTNKF